MYKTHMVTFLDSPKLEYFWHYHTNHTSKHHSHSVYITMCNDMTKKQIQCVKAHCLQSFIFLKTNEVQIICKRNRYLKKLYYKLLFFCSCLKQLFHHDIPYKTRQNNTSTSLQWWQGINQEKRVSCWTAKEEPNTYI